MIAAESMLCEELGLPHSVVCGDLQGRTLGGYTRHWRDGAEVVTLGPFEKVSDDGHAEQISDALTVRRDNAIVWVWMAHAIWALYKHIESTSPTKPAWDAHFDRLANDEVTNNYPGLVFSTCY
jgi:hypothetical protein